jgi:hypothetical protein
MEPPIGCAVGGCDGLPERRQLDDRSLVPESRECISSRAFRRFMNSSELLIGIAFAKASTRGGGSIGSVESVASGECGLREAEHQDVHGGCFCAPAIPSSQAASWQHHH